MAEDFRFETYIGHRRLLENDEDPKLVPGLERSYGIDLDDVDSVYLESSYWIRELCDEAINHLKLGNYTNLAKALGVSKSAISHWLQGTTFPGERTVVKLADLADEEPDLALAMLRYQLAKHPDTKNTYRTMYRLLATIKHKAAVALPVFLMVLLGLTASALAGTFGEPSNLTGANAVYYGKTPIRHLAQWLRRASRSILSLIGRIRRVAYYKHHCTIVAICDSLAGHDYRFALHHPVTRPGHV